MCSSAPFTFERFLDSSVTVKHDVLMYSNGYENQHDMFQSNPIYV